MFDANSLLRTFMLLVLLALGGCASLPDNPAEIAGRMTDQFDARIDEVGFRLVLQDDGQGVEQLRWHGMVDGKTTTFRADPHTSFWRRFGIGSMRLMPIESKI
jgi:putative cardiolipin synthase